MNHTRKASRRTMQKGRRAGRLVRSVAWVLTLAVVLPLFGGTFVYAQEPRDEGETGLCAHHPQHTAECGYTAPAAETPCTHVHDESCGYAPAAAETPCTHVHDASCGYAPAAAETPCAHVHDASCGYAPAVAETPCDRGCTQRDEAGALIHEEGCAYAPAAAETPCTHVHDAACGYAPAAAETPCTHAHDASCGYAPAVAETPCTHVHDESCGYAPAVEGTPCAFVCEACAVGAQHLVCAWAWQDDAELLVWSEEAGLWGLSLPGAGAANPLTQEALRALLPAYIDAQLEDGAHRTLAVEWDLAAIPEAGWAGSAASLSVAARLPEGYALGTDAPALTVLLELGGAEGYAQTPKAIATDYFNLREGTSVARNAAGEWEMVIRLPKEADMERRRELLRGLLPASVHGRLFSTYYQDGFVPDAQQKGDGRCWGTLSIQWDIPEQVGDETYRLVPQTAPSNTLWFINDITKLDRADDQQRLCLYVRVESFELNSEQYRAHAVEPDNVCVNLFDYWVADYGKSPTAASGGDILQKSDYHYRPKNFDSPEEDLSDSGVGFSTQQDWNLGINQGHLLLFGDGITHAGLWNKGAGENTLYARAYAGMEGIVRPVLENGYPVLNTANARLQMMGVTDPDDPNYRDYKLIRDYRLAGDHIGPVAGKNDRPQNYEGENIQNLSESLIRLWETETGKRLGTDTESLDYLFDPNVSSAYKTSYTDVRGLFQLDNEGYYYYNMRENFAEFQAQTEPADGKPGTGKFVLYSAPATTRTDAEHSIGNFLPFNRGVEVFETLDQNGKLVSNTDCSRNTMNHHLGMTVDIQFRQPIDGMISVGKQGRQPMTFEFSGDDDVWVFIDDVLVLDMGGTHSEIYGTIDFSTGKVCVGRAFDTKGIPDDPEDPDHLVTSTTLRALFEAAGRGGNDPENEAAWRGDTFASNSDHTLRMFYLERGNYDSSIALRFNLQSLLYQQIKKVDQDGAPLSGVSFSMYPARQENGAFVQSGTVPLATMTTGDDGTARFLKGEETDLNGNPLPFDFAEYYALDGTLYYILKETQTPQGYRPLPVDVVLEYHPDTTMLTVANRWVTGAFGSFTSTIMGNTYITYGAFDPLTGNINQSDNTVSKQAQEQGLVVAIPMVRIGSIWKALYGGNVTGFHAVKPETRSAEDWRKAALNAVLHQCVAAGEPNELGLIGTPWYLDWDEGLQRLTGMLTDLPGRADRYQLISGADADMKMVYAIIAPAVFTDLLHLAQGLSAGEQYAALADYVNGIAAAQNLSREAAVQKAVNDIYGVSAGENGRGISFLNVDQFVRNFRSLIYIPNEQRELRVWKVDEDGRGINDVRFGLYEDAACTQLVADGTTQTVEGRDGVLVFAPYDRGDGYATMEWASDVNTGKTDYYLKEMEVPEGSGLTLNRTVVPVHVGIYSIYADACEKDDGVKVMAGVGKLARTMIQYAADEDVEITLRDITAVGQTQASGSFSLAGWSDMQLGSTDVLRRMDLHYGKNALPTDYGLHDEDGGENQSVYPYFVTDEGYVRARVQQNYSALENDRFNGAVNDRAKSEDLGNTDLTSLFSLLNIVLVTDAKETTPTGQLTVSKTVKGEIKDGREEVLTDADYTKIYTFTLTLTDADGNALPGDYPYYYYGEDKAGKIANRGKLYLHHDEAVTILGLPAGTRYKVEEDNFVADHISPVEGFYEGEIEADQTATARFVNTKEKVPEELRLRKIVLAEGDTLTEEERTHRFAFTVKLMDKDKTPLRGTYEYYYGDDFSTQDRGEIEGTGTVFLSAGQQVTFYGLPAGAHYTVEEAKAAGWEVSEPAEGKASGELSGNQDRITEVTFTNEKAPPVGALRITKTATGDALTVADRAAMFSFTVTLKDTTGSALTDSYPFYMDGGTVCIGSVKSGDTISLHDGQSVEIRGLPAGSSYTVTEASARDWSLQTPASGKAEGEIVQDEVEEAAFVNRKNPPLGHLRISKTAAGDTLEDADRTRAFVFTVTLTDAKGKSLTGAYPYYLDGSETEAGAISSGGTLSLHDGQSAVVKDLPAGTVYTVAEAAAEGWELTAPAGGSATGSIVKDETAAAAFTNRKLPPAPQLGALRLAKTVTGDALTDADRAQRFRFTVTLKDTAGEALPDAYPYYLDGSDTQAGTLVSGGALSLHDGQSAVVKDLPAGTEYTITEETPEDWEITAPGSGIAAGMIEMDVTAQAAFTNHKIVREPDVPEQQIGRLILRKSVTGDLLTDADRAQRFRFTVTLTDEAGAALADSYPYYLNGETKTGDLESGDVLELSHGESVVINGLPAGAQYAVTEAAVTGWELTAPAGGTVTGSIVKDEAAEAAFVNHKLPPEPELGDLRIEKTVAGDALTDADRAQRFRFTVTLKDAAGDPLPDAYPYYLDGGDTQAGALASGGTLSLRGGQNAVVKDLPAGTKYTVTEAAAEDWELTAPAGGAAEGTIVKDAAAEAAFANRRLPPELGDLRIEKTVTGDALTDADRAQRFRFTVTLKDAAGNTLPDVYPYYLDGSAAQSGALASGGSILLHGGQNAVVKGLPAGTKYTVTEAAAEGWELTAPAGGAAAGAIEKDAAAEAAFTNRRLPPERGDLRIEKTVTGDALTDADRAQRFRFTITLKDAAGNTLPDVYPYYLDGGDTQAGVLASGSTLSLHGGQSAVVKGLPAGTAYTVAEAAAEGWELTAPAGGAAAGTIEKDAVAEAAFANRRLPPELGDLRIEKTVTGDALTDADRVQPFTFTVTLKDAAGDPLPDAYPYYLDGGDTQAGTLACGGTILLHDGQSAVVKGLPAGTAYTVAEAAAEGWELTAPAGGAAAGTIEKDAAAEAAFTNRRLPPERGDLRIEKTVTGDALTDADRVQPFTFTVTLKDAAGDPLPDAYPYYLDGGDTQAGTLASGGTILLHDGQSAVVKGLPAGTAYTVAEAAAEGWELTAPASGVAAGVIEKDATAQAAFTNHQRAKEPDVPVQQVGRLLLRKSVTGDALTDADRAQRFRFTVTLTDAAGAALTGSYPYYLNGETQTGDLESGDVLELRHGENVVIGGLPAGARYTVTEAAAEGWIITAPANGTAAGTIAQDETAEAAFINHKKPEPVTPPDEGPAEPPKAPDAAPPMGDSSGLPFWLCLGAISLLGLCVGWLTRFRPKKNAP